MANNFNPFMPFKPLRKAVTGGFQNRLANSFGIGESGQFEGWAPGSGTIRDRLTTRFGQPAPEAPAAPEGTPKDVEGVDRIDEARDLQLSAIDRALAMFRGGEGQPGLLDRISEITAPLEQTLTDRTGRVEGNIAEAKGTANKALDEANARRQEITDQSSREYNRLWNDWDNSVNKAREDWDYIKGEYKDTAALQTQRVVAGLRTNADQMASQIRAQGEAAGVPKDQIEAQVRSLKMDTMFEAGRVMGDAAVQTNAKLAEINMHQTNLIAGLEAGGWQAMTGSFATLVSANIQSAMQVLEAEKNKMTTELGAAGQELELNNWITGTQATIAGLKANAEVMSTQAVQALEAMRVEVEQGNVENWMQWQVAFSSMLDMVDNLYVETQT